MKIKPSIILLIEDEEAHVDLIKVSFRRARILNEIFVVTDGQVALDYLFRRGEYTDPASSPRPMLILLDLKLPKVDGLDVLQQIKEDPDLRLTPIVIITTSNQEKDVQRSYELGANGYMNKPLNIEDLQAIVGDLGILDYHQRAPQGRRMTPEDSLPLGGNG